MFGVDLVVVVIGLDASWLLGILTGAPIFVELPRGHYCVSLELWCLHLESSVYSL
jgi:hypothetical protein